MKKYFTFAVLLSSIVLVISGSCAAQEFLVIQPNADFNTSALFVNSVLVENIIETKEGGGNSNIPEWLLAYFAGGNEEIERLNQFFDKYCFVGMVEGRNLSALGKWAENFSVVYDFPKIAASRIEMKMIREATLYPDDEYGEFFEAFVKKAFDAEFPEALLEDSFWIKNSEELYQYYILISTDKLTLQAFIVNMFNEVLESVSPNRQQNNAIRRLQQNFFDGF